MIGHIRPAISMTVLMTLLTGVAYPLAMTGAAQALFPAQANGSLIFEGDRVIGSRLIGQSFAAPEYLHGRPSAVAYDAANSSATNLAPTNAELVAAIRERAAAIEAETGDLPPIDLVTASGSGLDPHVSPEAAALQATRIAVARGIQVEAVEAILAENTEGAYLGFIGEPVVNVLGANLDLDATHPVPTDADAEQTATNE